MANDRQQTLTKQQYRIAVAVGIVVGFIFLAIGAYLARTFQPRTTSLNWLWPYIVGAGTMHVVYKSGDYIAPVLEGWFDAA